MNIDRGLNTEQKRAVYHYKGPVLVLAGPGSGKTRVITRRVAYLIRHHNIPPESVLAVTFTNKAAGEMKDRLHSDALLGETIGVEVWIHTFHAACVRILREHGEKIGLSPRFGIVDQEKQEKIIAHYIRDLAGSISENQIWMVRNFISDAKLKLEDPTKPHETASLNRIMEDDSQIVTMEDLLEITRRYQGFLEEHDALDYDDLVCKAVNLLADHTDVRDGLQKQFQFIMVDEYQDINPAQYELIEHLCGHDRNLMVVADDDQSIYSWRGSDPSFIDRFRESYKPKEIHLVDHFRSTQSILRASQSLIRKNTRRKKSTLITDNDRGGIVYHYKLDTAEEELRLVEWLIRRLIREKRYSPGQIAIFYRTHRLADKLEQYLMERKIEVNRIRRESFFDDTSVRAIVDYLRLSCWNPEMYIDGVVNFPDMVMDELTKLQLERLAKRNRVEFGSLLRSIAEGETSSVEVGPLTRKRIRHFISSLDDFISSLTDESVSDVMRRLFDFLELRRCPYHTDDLAAIHSPDELGNLWQPVNALYGNIQQKSPVSIIAFYGMDNYCAAGILMHVLQNYLDMGENVTCQFLPPDDDSKDIELESFQQNAVYIVIGSRDSVPDNMVEHAILMGVDVDGEFVPCIANLPAGEGGVVSTTALKFCQRLLTAYESDNTDGLVVYDLETTGNNPKTAEIVEIGAKKLGVRRSESEFQQLVKPRGKIPEFSTKIHGITNEDVKDEPSIEAALPSFLDFIGDSILVGHNIEEFDNKVINRQMVSYMGRAELTNGSYDTLSVSRRLFPLENYRLNALADKFGIEYGDLHRADKDVELNQRVFRELRRKDLGQVVQTSLPEVLPLIAIGILEKNAAMEKENIAFYNAALRYLRQRRESDEAVEVLPVTNLESAEQEEAITFLDIMRKAEPSDTKDDIDWNLIKAKFQNIVLDFERSSYDKSLNAFLGYAVLLTSADLTEEDEEDDKITMMTVHSAKGTEFPVVIMIGMEQGNFPILPREQSEEEFEEERRLCYVGMTRAEKQLYMTSVRRRMSDREMTPSQFIWEIQPDLIETVSAKQIRKAWDKERQERQKAKAGSTVGNG
ncbi:UvrD-helicase domain-containing protein [Candidatus Poribacteria bacterium]